MRRITALMTAAVVVGTALLAAQPAGAATWSTSDPNYDAPAFLDVANLKVNNTKAALTVRAIVPGFDPAALDRSLLGAGNEFTSLDLYVTVRGSDASAWTPRWGTPGKFKVEVGPAGLSGVPDDRTLLSRLRGASYFDIACKGIRSTVAKGSVSTTIPQSCFRRVTGKNAGAVKVKAIMRGNVGPTSREDRTYTTPLVKKS